MTRQGRSASTEPDGEEQAVKVSINARQALDLLEEVVEGNESFVYTTPEVRADCAYVHEDEEGNLVPGCIVGHALHRAGVDLWKFAPIEGRQISGDVDGTPAIDVLGVEAAPGAVDVLQAAQSVQDVDGTWGEALEAAREAALVAGCSAVEDESEQAVLDLLDEIQQLANEHQGEAEAFGRDADTHRSKGGEDSGLLDDSQAELPEHT